MDHKQLEQLQARINASVRIVFFGGAGVSTESGLPDFRSVDGLYQQKYPFPPETMLSHAFLSQHPEDFFRFYREKLVYPDARPNAAHRKLAELEAAGRLSAVITQNIDGLHQMAGSRVVIELHGSVQRNYCLACSRRFGLDAVLASSGVPRCPCGGLIRPDVVLYGERLDPGTLQRAMSVLSRADLLIVGGTSLAVYPAAGLVDGFRGSRLVLINRQIGPLDEQASLAIHGSIGEVLDAITVTPPEGSSLS